MHICNFKRCDQRTSKGAEPFTLPPVMCCTEAQLHARHGVHYRLWSHYIPGGWHCYPYLMRKLREFNFAQEDPINVLLFHYMLGSVLYMYYLI